jgi:hypothetical protein
MTEGNYSNVGHRGPVYKGLGAMNPCDIQYQLLVYPDKSKVAGRSCGMKLGIN